MYTLNDKVWIVGLQCKATQVQIRSIERTMTKYFKGPEERNVEYSFFGAGGIERNGTEIFKTKDELLTWVAG